MEIERKFLVTSNTMELIRDMEDVKKKYIEQAYVSIEPEVRVRMTIDDTGKSICYKTEKSNGNLIREERETVISMVEYMIYADSAITDKVKKIRYYIDIEGGLIAEVDDYKNIELAVVEVEFDSVDASTEFIKPIWFDREVTKDTQFKNKNIAKMITGIAVSNKKIALNEIIAK